MACGVAMDVIKRARQQAERVVFIFMLLQNYCWSYVNYGNPSICVDRILETLKIRMNEKNVVVVVVY